MLMKITPMVNINILHAAFAPLFFHQKNSKSNCDQRNAGQNTLVQKNVDEIDIFSQFHQHFTHNIFVQKSFEHLFSS